MNCDEAIRAASEAWGGGPLPASLSAHLRSCASCSAEREELDRLLDDLSDSPVPDPGQVYWASFGDRVLRRIRQDDASPRERPVWAWIAVPAAAVTVIALASVLLLWQRAEAPATLEGDQASLEARMEMVLQNAAASGLDEIEALEDLAIFGSNPVAVGAGEDPWEDGATVEQAGDLAAVFAGEALTAWPEWAAVDRLLDGLTDAQAQALIRELDNERTTPSPAGA